MNHSYQPHYIARMEIRWHGGRGESWKQFSKHIRQWVAKKLEREGIGLTSEFWGNLFYVGGEWQPEVGSPYYLRVVRENGDGNLLIPQFWACRYKHPDSEVKSRSWQVDIGLQRIEEEAFRLAVSVSHKMRSGFIGRAPRIPSPTAPSFVFQLLSDMNWTANSGKAELSSTAQKLSVGEGKQFVELLRDSDRMIPVVLVTHHRAEDKALINVGKLCRITSGTAVVYEVESCDIDEELLYVMTSRFNAWNGMVRVYLPQVKFEHPFDGRRHRYFSARDIVSNGSEEVLEVLAESLSRRPLANRGFWTYSIDDVRSAAREKQLRELRAKHLANDELQDYIDVFDEDIKKKDAEIEDLQYQLVDTQEVISTLEEEIRRLKYSRDHQRKQVSNLTRANQELGSKDQVISNLSTLPSSLKEVVDLFAVLNSEKVQFSEEALESAAEYNFENVQEAWLLLYSMASILHDAFFTRKLTPAQIVEEYQSNCNFELSLTEGTKTREDKTLMAKRRIVFDGKEFDISYHVKIGSKPPRLLRVYFAPYQERSLLVIGHCGDHLDTYGTRRRS